MRKLWEGKMIRLKWIKDKKIFKRECYKEMEWKGREGE